MDLLDEQTLYRFMAQPGAFAMELEAVKPGSWVVVDEIQKMPNLLNEVHRFIENRGLKFALCGSSARKLRKAGVNLLAGRALNRHMYPFMASELGSDFDIEDVLRSGALPVAWGSKNKAERLEAYVMMYLNEEIRAEAAVRNLPAFTRFVTIAALMHGQTINLTGIARDCGVSRTTVASYIDILEQTLLCTRLAAYDGKLRVKERKLPKLFWVDPGLVRAAKRQLHHTLVAEERGHLFEGLVFQTLLAYRDYRRAFDDIYYWAPSSSSASEVDFVVVRGDQVVAIEVKSGSIFNETWCRGLRAFGSRPEVKRRIVVCPNTPDLRLRDGIEVISYRGFEKQLHQNTLFNHDL